MPRRIVMALTLLAAAVSIATPTRAMEPAECPRTFELVTPGDWRCTEEGVAQCTVCRNRSPHFTDLLIRCVEDGTRERKSMPPGGALSICGGQEL